MRAVMGAVALAATIWGGVAQASSGEDAQGRAYQQLLTQAFKRGGKPVRLLGVGVRLRDLRGAHEQLELFPPK